jgi:hypothetical protein
MRGLMISMFIVTFCFSVEALNALDQDFISENGRSLFGIGGFNVTTPITHDSLDGVGNRADANETLFGFVTPAEQPTGLGLQDLYAITIILFRGVSFILRTLFMSTFGFFFWLDDMGTGHTFVPDIIVYPISIMVYILYIFTVVQIIVNRNLKSGGI